MASMANKFYGGSSSDESESDSDSAASEGAPASGVQGTGRGFTRYAFDSDSDSDDEERIVRSKTDRVLEGLAASVVIVRNALRINDWASLQDGAWGA